MAKDHVQQVVIKHLHRLIPETAAAPVRLDAPLNELGVDSLDLLDVTSHAMMELGVKLPRSEVSGIKRLQDIIDALDRAQNNPETSAQWPPRAPLRRPSRPYAGPAAGRCGHRAPTPA